MVVGPLVLSPLNTLCRAVFMCTCAYMEEGTGLGSLHMQGPMTYIEKLCVSVCVGGGGGGGGGGRPGNEARLAHAAPSGQ